MEAEDILSYCERLRQDLTDWKARIYDLVKGLDKMPSEKKSMFKHSVDGLHELAGSIERRLSRLEKECPVQWGSEKIVLDKEIKELQAACELVWPDYSPDDLE